MPVHAVFSIGSRMRRRLQPTAAVTRAAATVGHAAWTERGQKATVRGRPILILVRRARVLARRAPAMAGQGRSSEASRLGRDLRLLMRCRNAHQR